MQSMKMKDELSRGWISRQATRHQAMSAAQGNRQLRRLIFKPEVMLSASDISKERNSRDAIEAQSETVFEKDQRNRAPRNARRLVRNVRSRHRFGGV